MNTKEKKNNILIVDCWDANSSHSHECNVISCEDFLVERCKFIEKEKNKILYSKLREFTDQIEWLK